MMQLMFAAGHFRCCECVVDSPKPCVLLAGLPVAPLRPPWQERQLPVWPQVGDVAYWMFERDVLWQVALLQVPKVGELVVAIFFPWL